MYAAELNESGRGRLEVEGRNEEVKATQLEGGDAEILLDTSVKQDGQKTTMNCISPISTVANRGQIKENGGNYKTTQAPTQEEKKEKDSGPRMTKAFLKDHCKQNKLYVTPRLNDTLYLHFKGFSTIENLEEYTGLKCLWLESNGLQRIQNLEAQAELRCLFLQQNLIHKLENLHHLSKLCTLNVSNNYIHTIENISCLPELSTLQIAQNKLETVENVEHLSQCLAVSVLDLSHNLLKDPEILTALESMPQLRVLNLTGNEVVKKIPNYRKTLIVRLKQLTYLDDRPVFPKERACAEAWAVGGLEGERKERELWQTRERRQIQDGLDAMAAVRDEARERKRLRELHERGEFEASVVPESESSCEKKLTQNRSPGREEKILAFVQDSLDAHEEFLQKQREPTEPVGPDEENLDREHLEGDQSGEGLMREQMEDNHQDQPEIKQPEREETERESSESYREQKERASTVAEMLERGQLEDTQQQSGIKQTYQFESVENQAEREEANREKLERKQPACKQPLLSIRAAPRLDEEIKVHGPGPLVTELEEMEQLETIHLQPQRSLCIDDLPDLEDIDTEDQDSIAIFSSQQGSRPKIEVISGDSDEDKPMRYQCETTLPRHSTPTLIPDTDSLFVKVCDSKASTEVPSNPFLDPETGDACELMISEPQGEPKPNQVTQPPRCLIEELD